MKCPKCKKEMTGVVNGLDMFLGEMCDNPKCWFYRIKRFVERGDGK